MKKTFLLLFAVLAALSLRADVLFQDATNYPYTNGCIEGQGQWYCYSPAAPALDALVTNNILLLNTTNHDAVAAPTNGWNNATEFNYASFTINVSQLPGSPNGGYFCQLQDNNDTNDCCHVFIDTRDTVVPGTYRLGIANFATSFAALTPPVNYPMDLATNTTYTVVILFDGNAGNTTFAGSTLWINPSPQDYQNVVDGDDIGVGLGNGYVYGTDIAANSKQENINVTQIGFSPYANAGISNVIVATTFAEVNTTNLPVFGIQPRSGTNYSGNSVTYYAVASGVDVAYQWYSQTSGLLHDDGVNIVGSTSNVLVINNLAASDNYYAVATDAYGNMVASATATNTVITTQTPPFFPSMMPVNLTNNLFTSAGFTNLAFGTGPLYYQWYFAPTNAPNTYSALAGQTGPSLVLNLADYTFAGNYYVIVSNAVAGGSVASSPTNSITELAPLVATISQLHNLMVSLSSQIVANKSGTVTVNSNNVTVGGYVTDFNGLGSTYTEFFIQDAAGYGIEVYLGGAGNTNTPPVGTYVTVSGPVVIYHTELEIEPAALAAIATNVVAPPGVVGPRLANASFNDLSTNGLGTNALLTSCSLVTFTNVYIYGNKTGGAIGNGGIFYSNGYTATYFTIGQYHYPDNTNWIEIYQFASNYGTNVNPFANLTVPTYCAQVTGAYLSYGGTPEILPSRPADYVVNPPAPFTTGIAEAKHVPTLQWPVQPGSTYSVASATSLLGPWTQVAYGLGYYPTSGAFTDTNAAAAKFYRVSCP